jgi:hypothetical protein
MDEALYCAEAFSPITGRSGDRRLAGCHVIQRERPQTLSGLSRPAPAALRAAAGRSRPSDLPLRFPHPTVSRHLRPDPWAVPSARVLHWQAPQPCRSRPVPPWPRL